TQASGVVSKVYIENGQNVKSGDKIAELDLDMVGKQRSSQALASYLSAKNNLENAKINYYALQSDLLTNWKSFMDLAQTSLYENSDKSPHTANRQLPEFMITNVDWLSAEAKYKQQANIVRQTQTSLNSAWGTYQQTSSTIYAPISGKVTGLSLQVGSVLTAQSNTSGTAASQKIASIQTDASPIIQVNLTQVDTPKVKIGNKVTITFDAFPGKSFSGKVISIDTIGTVSSGVTTYPAYIKLDTEVPEIFSNMTANANIITQIKDNILIVPLSSVQTTSGSSTVRVMKDNQVTSADVEVGESNDTQTEIVSGVSEGDIIITGQTNTTTGSTGTTTSPFGNTRGGFGGAGGLGGAAGGGQRR
ncbi:hypothetical protein A2W14_03105, partial [Candidatus Gottesmanbacteria bacterium RBG_16_37_8]